MSPLQESLPWTKSPLIVNGPMAFVADPPLAIAVTQAGGLGMIGSDGSPAALRTHLSTAAASLTRTPAGFLPVGIGLLTCFAQSALDAAVDVLAEFAPQVVWLFAAGQAREYAAWAAAVRAKCRPGTQLWVQVGSVASALEVAASARPDALCVQGSDAGGHGLEAGAGVVALLPEVADALAAEVAAARLERVPALLGAGGLVDARGAAAAFVLGAQGVVLGTRFLAAPESKMHAGYRSAVLATADGGQRTVRSKLFDEVKGPNRWPAAYDGRSIRNRSFEDYGQGVGLDEIRQKFKDAVQADDAGYADDGTGRATMWAGTAVGLVKQEQAAAEIVEEVRTGIADALERAKSRL